ncbi:unnamed protein product [Symbiodinium natans]|uniref:Fe2OG dioxygenase domain-containing protein n=1 Tax=Symbiodinium natans TaxID=878477 RepID=A0A812I339_9DINO|nr:unnamed protein product [Symbiodinium natans]
MPRCRPAVVLCIACLRVSTSAGLQAVTLPSGFRVLKLPLKVARDARSELDACLSQNRRKLEMQFSFTTLNGGRGRLRSLPGPDAYPACDRLMTASEKSFGLACDRALVQVMVRQYQPGRGLKLHVDSKEMFEVLKGLTGLASHGLAEEPVLAVVLCAGGAGEATVPVVETTGLAMCFQGEARYDWGHKVPPVSERRLSITWRWFCRSYLDRFDFLDQPV